MNDIQTKLDQLAALKTQRAALDDEYTRLRNEILRPVADDLAALEAEIEPKADELSEQIGRLEGEITEAVSAEGETVKGDSLQAVFAKGRVTWDAQAMDGYAAAHPEINPFRKVGKASVTIRAIGR